MLEITVNFNYFLIKFHSFPNTELKFNNVKVYTLKKPNKNKINNKSWTSEQFGGAGVLSDTFKFTDAFTSTNLLKMHGNFLEKIIEMQEYFFPLGFQTLNKL